MSTPLVELGVAIGAALLLSLLFYRLGFPMAVGQLVAGMTVGPYGLKLITTQATIELLSSLGILLLLFVIGLELDPRDLRRIGRKIVVLTTIEYTLSLLVGIASGFALGWTFREALFLGAIFSISSTAIIAKVVFDRGPSTMADQDERSVVLALLMVEDVIAVLLLLLLPELVDAGQVQLSRLLLIAGQGALLCIVTIGFGRYVAPRLINWVSQYEVEVGEASFLLALFFGFLFGVLSALLGFSPAVGAFLIGLTLLGKHSRYVKEKIMPIKDLFIVFFFVSMGTLVDPGAALTVGLIPLAIVILAATGGKFLGGLIGAKAARVSSPLLIAGLLIPRGEFTLLLARQGIETGLVPLVLYPIAGFTVLATTLATRAFSPPPAPPLPARPEPIEKEAPLPSEPLPS